MSILEWLKGKASSAPLPDIPPYECSAREIIQRASAYWTVEGNSFFTQYDVASMTAVAEMPSHGVKILAFRNSQNKSNVTLRFNSAVALNYLSTLLSKSVEIFGLGYKDRLSGYISRNERGERVGYKLIDIGEMREEGTASGGRIGQNFAPAEVEVAFTIPEELRSHFGAESGHFSLPALSVMYCPSIKEHFDPTARKWVVSKNAPPNQLLIIAKTGVVSSTMLNEIRLSFDNAATLRRFADLVKKIAGWHRVQS